MLNDIFFDKREISLQYSQKRLIPRSFLIVLTWLFLLAFVGDAAAKAPKPAVLLAKNDHPNIAVEAYLVSEKLDGVRAVWNGQSLITRNGHIIHAPSWFTKGFPKAALDGELWIARNEFDRVSGIVRQLVPDDQAWQRVQYCVFELPNAEGTFSERYAKIQRIVKIAGLKHLIAVKQFKVKDRQALTLKLNAVVAQGGEGLMLHKANALYHTGRSDDLIKLKPSFDEEGVVVAYVPGKGKYLGKMGALIVEAKSGIRFKLGTGFSDAQRENPPPIGSMITYTYKNKTKAGKPRFASFLRIRQE